MLLLLKYLRRLWRERRAPATRAPSASAPDTPVAGRAGRSAAARGPIALLAHQVRYDLRAGLRNPRARFFTFFFPVVLLVIFAGVFHGNTTVAGVHIKLSRYFVAGILAMSIVFASYANLVIQLATLRESGVLKRRRATPVRPVVLIASQAICTVVTAAVMTALLLVLARLLYGIGMSPGAIAAIACTAGLGALCFACIGYAVSGLIGSPDAAQPIVQATTMPLWFISGVLIPTQNVTGALRTIGSIFPVAHLANGLHLASIGTSFTSAISIENLVVLAAWRFSWLPSTATP
jgi:ABC-2 type transport system permease protein